MNTQTLTFSMMTCNFIVALPEEPTCASSRDYGFDFDEQELACELLVPLPITPAAQPFPEVDAKDFEQAFQTFFS